MKTTQKIKQFNQNKTLKNNIIKRSVKNLKTIKYSKSKKQGGQFLLATQMSRYINYEIFGMLVILMR